MNRLTAILGYSAASLTILGAVGTPFVLMRQFTRAIGAMGLKVDPATSGGDPARTISRGSYYIVVHKPVEQRGWFSRVDPYVQVTWTLLTRSASTWSRMWISTATGQWTWWSGSMFPGMCARRSWWTWSRRQRTCYRCITRRSSRYQR